MGRIGNWVRIPSGPATVKASNCQYHSFTGGRGSTAMTPSQETCLKNPAAPRWGGSGARTKVKSTL